MQRTLTKSVGDRKFFAIEDQSLTGCDYGLMRAGDNRVRVSPSVFKLMRDDFDRVASVLKIRFSKSRRGGDANEKERVLSELSAPNDSVQPMRSMRRKFQYGLHRKPKKAA